MREEIIKNNKIILEQGWEGILKNKHTNGRNFYDRKDKRREWGETLCLGLGMIFWKWRSCPLLKPMNEYVHKWVFK